MQDMWSGKWQHNPVGRQLRVREEERERVNGQSVKGR